MKSLPLLIVVLCAAASPLGAQTRPDFTGVWAGPGFTHVVGPGDTDTPRVTTYDAKNFSPVRPGGEAFLKKKMTGDVSVDDPTAVCLPNGLTRQILSPYAQQWIQTPTQMIILYEYMHFFRVIPIGAPNRAHEPDVEQTWMGDSIGWWEGDTFVIDTIGLKEWMLDATTATYGVTIDDPNVFTKPWSQQFGMKLHPTWKIFEFVCEENNRCRGGQCVASEAQK